MKKSFLALLIIPAFLLTGCVDTSPPPPPPSSAIDLPQPVAPDVALYDAVKNWAANTYGVEQNEEKYTAFRAAVLEEPDINTLQMMAGTPQTYVDNLGYLGASADPALDIDSSEFADFVAEKSGLGDVPYWEVSLHIAQVGAQILR